MLIVIVIIGILAAALIPRLTGIQGRTRDVARKADLQQIGTSLSIYKIDKGTYPLSLPGWSTGFEHTIFSGVASYMTSFPQESNAVVMPYAYVSNGTTFALAAISEGGKANANWSGTSANASALPAVFSGGVTTGSTAVSLSSQLCINGGSSETCVGTTASGSPRYVYIN